MKIIALISSYQEGELLNSAIDSTLPLDMTMVFEGMTTADANIDGKFLHPKISPNGVSYRYYEGWWKSDADKRTDMLEEAKAYDDDAWIIWVDADEILLYGEYLKDHVRRAEQETATGGTTIRIVEYDGSVAQCYGKIVRASKIKHYIMSSYEIELENGMVVALPNVPICSAGGIPIGEITQRDDPMFGINRPPLIGEPHLLHRHGLRDPKREAPRLHDKEAEDFQKLVEGESK